MPTESKTPRSDTAVATLCAVGDIRITDELLQAARQGGSYDFSDILRGTTAVVGAADVAIGNLETTLSGEPYNDGSAPDALATALRSTGFSLVQTANSYTIQNGLSGLERTQTVLRSAGLTPVGTYERAESRRSCGGERHPDRRRSLYKGHERHAPAERRGILHEPALHGL